ncbi:hypothetical protein [Brachyspira murdochii]|uniref:hypothetical protein n=1 Tax=Brachyspira murdochii TaxID=84378 RepID=UPI001E30E688|nr:hypothetical protein [Brachyspira murdochii]
MSVCILTKYLPVRVICFIGFTLKFTSPLTYDLKSADVLFLVLPPLSSPEVLRLNFNEVLF